MRFCLKVGEVSRRSCEAVVLAPTRELCSQIHLEAKKLSFASPAPCHKMHIYQENDGVYQVQTIYTQVDT